MEVKYAHRQKIGRKLM